MSFDSTTVSRLDGSSDMLGGLIVKKSDKNTSKSLSTGSSRLGLQKLAEAKRKERELEEEMTVKKSKSNTWEDDDYGGERTSSSKHRHYRSKMVETPSHPGGVSNVYKEKKQQRDKRDREQRRGGVYADTKQGKDKDRRMVMGLRRDKDSWSKNDRKGDTGSKRERSSRSKGDSSRSTQGGYDWESTPSSGRSRSEREYTPSYSSRGLYGCKARL